MQRQRGELVPIGEVVSGLDGPVRALRETPPPARRGFTVADQVNQLVGASEADPNLGFMGRTMALCSLPRSNPGNRKEYKRVNGPFTLYIVAGGGNKLPFGNVCPVCCWLGSRPKRYGPKAASWFWVVRRSRSLPVVGLPHLRAPLRLSWRQVYRQFGAHPDNAHDKKTVQNFRIKVLRELKKIKMAWPGLNYTTAPGVLILHPSTPVIAPVDQCQLAS